MADVAAHEDEGRRYDACEAADVPDAVAWGVEHVEASIVEEVVGGELADVEICVEREGDEFSACEVGFVDGRLQVEWVARSLLWKSGPTIREVVGGKRETSPVWSQWCTSQ